MNSNVLVEYPSDTRVRLTCVLSAPAERVYRAWTTPSEIARWFVCQPGSTCEVPSMDVRVGGTFQLRITVPNALHTVDCEFLELVPSRLIRFSWNPIGADPVEISEVTVALDSNGAGTELTLTHSRFTSIESRDAHEAGWKSCLSGLHGYLS